jgi:hypothetical protein
VNRSQHPLPGPELAGGILERFAKREEKTPGTLKFTPGQRQMKGFLQELSNERTSELLELNRKQARKANCNLKRHVFKLGLVNNPA